MKFSGLMCLVMKTTCGKLCCQKTSMQKVIALTFTYINPQLAYSIEWHMRDSVPCAYECM